MAKKNAKKAAQPVQKPQPQPEPHPPIQKAQSTPTPAEPQSQSQSQSNPPPAQQPQKSPMAPSNRARLLWRTFETWAREQQGSMNADFDKISRDMDMLWRSTPKQHRDSKADFEKRKADQRREKEAPFYEKMRTEWQKRLDDAGLRDEDWDDITEEESLMVMHLLGGDVEVGGEDVMISEVPILPTPLSTGSRSTNSSLDYDIVSPSMFRSDAEDEKGFDLFDITSFNDDTNSEASASNPWSWESEASGYNTETPQSSSHSSPKLSSDAISLGGYVKVPAARSSQPQSVSTKTSEKKKQTRYIGPHLVDHDDYPHDDEAAFANFKMQMRILKIQEFHAEATEADIELALQIVETQSKTKVHEVLVAHEQRLLLLRERKEAERKALVEAERQKRKKAIRERSTQRVAPPVGPNLFGESDKDDLSPLVQQPQKEVKAGRKKKSASTKNDESPAPTQNFSQDTVRRKVAPSSEDKETNEWNPFDYDIKALLNAIPGSMPPPIGSSFPTFASPPTDGAAGPSQQNSRPAPVSRTTSSTSRVSGREFWVPPTASELKQAPAPKGKIATANNHFDPPPPTNLAAVPQDTKSITSRSSSFTRQGEPLTTSQSHSASSSKTTLEDMRPADPRSFWQPPNMIRSTSTLNLNSQPNRHEIWIPPSQDASRTRALSSAIRPPEAQVPSSSNGSQIQKSQSMPQGPSETVPDKRSRRMSDPVSPSPRNFLLPVENNSALDNYPALGIPTKGKTGKSGKGKCVTIEDVPDDEEEDRFEHLPSDSKHIMEPKPVVPSEMFEQILDYEEEVSSIPLKTTNIGWDKVMEDKAVRTKHVRWTPSVVGGSPVSAVVPDDDKEPPRTTNGRDKKGKGRLADSGDDLSRFAKEALAGLKQMGGKAR